MHVLVAMSSQMLFRVVLQIIPRDVPSHAVTAEKQIIHLKDNILCVHIDPNLAGQDCICQVLSSSSIVMVYLPLMSELIVPTGQCSMCISLASWNPR